MELWSLQDLSLQHLIIFLCCCSEVLRNFQINFYTDLLPALIVSPKINEIYQLRSLSRVEHDLNNLHFLPHQSM